MVNVLRCRLSFIIQRLVLLCIRGTRKAAPKIENDLDYEFVCFASKLISDLSHIDSVLVLLSSVCTKKNMQGLIWTISEHRHFTRCESCFERAICSQSTDIV